MKSNIKLHFDVGDTKNESDSLTFNAYLSR